MRALFKCTCIKGSINPLRTKINQSTSKTLSPYRAVNTLRVGYTNQSVNVV